MGRLLAILATFLILVLGAAFVVPAFTDWNAYRPDIEQAASAILGRKVNIVGDIDIALLPEPHFSASKVATEGSDGDAVMMSAEAVDLSLSLQALLAGRLEANRLKLLRPVLLLDLSKPFNGAVSKTEPEGALPVEAGVKSLEIEEGRVSVFEAPGEPEALTLTGLDGTLFSPAPGSPFRFNGRVSEKNRRFDVKFLAAATAGSGIKLTGSATELASKTVLQADGVVSATDTPVFEGAITLTAPRAVAASGAPIEVQVKGGARINPAGMALSDLILTIDPENHPQVLIGSANAAFASETADLTLQARSIDADALIASGGASHIPAGATPGWKSLRDAADQLLWLYPDFGLHLSLAADQLQLQGELIEGVKLDGTRSSGKWAFEQSQATLPGETAIKFSGGLTKPNGGTPELKADVAFDGKNLGRLTRWIAPPAPNARPAPARAFAAQGLVTLANDVTAFEGVTGNIEGTPFTASLHLDKGPIRRLQVALTGDNFDLSSLESGQSGAEDTLSAEAMTSAWQSLLSQLAPLLGDEQKNFDTADIDVSAGTIKTSFIEARNVAVQAKFNQDLLTVSKLAAETNGGLTLRGEGVVPLRGAGQGRFDGRLEARTGQAVLQLAALAGYDTGSLGGRRADDLAPAALSISYGTEAQPGSATAQLGGNLGTARVEGRAQMKGNLAEWRKALLSAQVNVSAADGNTLVALLFPKAVPGASLSPGTIAIHVNGNAQRLETAGSIKTAALQAQIDGTAEFKTPFAFDGKVSASSQMPEQFLPPTFLALFGVEPKSNLRIETNLAYAASHIDASKLRAESAKNAVTGHLAIDIAGHPIRVDADLKADQLSLPSLLSFLLTQPPSGQGLLTPFADLWSERPFNLGAFQDTAAKVTIAAKTLKLGDTFVISDVQAVARLERGRLDILKLDGKALGGDFGGLFSLEPRGSTATAATRISLSNADLSALPSPGAPAIVSGKASLFLQASGQGLSPRGLISVLQGRGYIALSDGQVAKISPAAVQKSAEDLTAAQLPLTEDVITKKVFEASQSSDLKFKRLKIPVVIRDGILEIRRASFRNQRDGTVRMEAYLDLSKMQADTTWQAGVSSDRRAKWPPVKLQIAGPLRELGARPRTLVAEDFVRAVLLHKMEGDISRLEGLNKPQTATPSWTTTQEPAAKPARRKRDASTTAAQPDAAVPADAAMTGSTDFEKRMRDALQSRSSAPPDSR